MLEKLVIRALEETKKLISGERVDKSLSAKQNILKYDDVFVEMLTHILKPVSDSNVIEIWKKSASEILQACEGEICFPFKNGGREGIEIYLEKVIFEHFAIYGFGDKIKGKR